MSNGKLNKELKDFMELVDILKEQSEHEKKVKQADKKIIISIDDNATDDCGCIGIQLQNVDRGAELALATASLIATCLDHAVKGKEAETVTLILMLALEVFKHSNSPEEAREHQEEDLQKLKDFLDMINKDEEE
jgi:hypothetical protein